jgi:fructose-bisphosphate aldolase class I
MNCLAPQPWELSFSYGRALQQPALQAWGGKPEQVAAAQAALYRRAQLNGAARRGEYVSSMESAGN